MNIIITSTSRKPWGIYTMLTTNAYILLLSACTMFSVDFPSASSQSNSLRKARQSDYVFEIKIGVYLAQGPEMRIYYSYNDSLKAIEVALEHVQQQQLLPNTKLNLLHMDTHCDMYKSALGAAELVYREGVHVFVGPFCDMPSTNLARYASVWDIPVITPSSLSDSFAVPYKRTGTGEFSTMTRIQAPYRKGAELVVEVLLRYMWNTVYLLFDNKDSGAGFTYMNPEIQYCFRFIQSLFNIMKQNKAFNINYRMFQGWKQPNYEELLQELSEKGRSE